jgi:hypothetical protein
VSTATTEPTPLTADMVIRLRRSGAPVQVGHAHINGDPSVVMVLDPEYAQALAKVLALFDARHPAGGLDFEFDRDQWTHTMVDLLAGASLASGRHAELASVTHMAVGR